MKLDILALSAHPDDAELGCGGTLAHAASQGKKVGIYDLTKGELGTRGTVEVRQKEAADASEILGLAVRGNLGFKDAFFANDQTHQLALMKIIRQHQPEIVLAAAPNDRHPDHPRASNLIVEACFMSGLSRIVTKDQDHEQMAWRPKAVYHYIQSVFLTPDFVVDVSDHWETKMQSIRAYESQFFNNDGGPQTYISNPRFLKMVEARGTELGHSIGVDYGEGYLIDRNLGVKDLFDLL